MGILEHYRGLHKNAGIVLESSFSDDGLRKIFTASHNFIGDFNLMKLPMDARPEVELLDLAIKEYQFALYAVSVGQYRHAYIGLRLFFELALSCMHFSVREFELRQWLGDRRDIVWASLKDLENGIFSKNFISLFDDSLAEFGRQYCTIAEAVYRECSEYVHGNAKTHEAIPSSLEFDKAALCDWHEKAKSMRMVLVFAFCCRHLPSIKSEDRDKLEVMLLEVLGHLAPVRKYFQQ